MIGGKMLTMPWRIHHEIATAMHPAMNQAMRSSRSARKKQYRESTDAKMYGVSVMYVFVVQNHSGLKRNASVPRTRSGGATPAKNSNRLIRISVRPPRMRVEARRTSKDSPKSHVQSAPQMTCARSGGVVSIANWQR